jgi:threonine dehydratase
VNRQIVRETQAIDQGAGFFHDDPDGVREMLDAAARRMAALGIAAILEDRNRFAGRHVATIVCGSIVDVDAYHRWVGAAAVHRSRQLLSYDMA